MEMEVFLNHPGLRSIGQDEYKGLIFVNEKSFRIHLLKTEAGWMLTEKDDFTPAKNYQHSWQFLDAYTAHLDKLHPAHVPVPVHIYRRVVKEYKEFANFYMFLENVQLASDLTQVSVTYVDARFRNHEMTMIVNYGEGKLFHIGSVKLPVDVKAADDSLISLFEIYLAHVEACQHFFDVLDVIDQHLWVVDPAVPTRTDVKRRVVLCENLTVEFTFGPKYPMEFPTMRLLGPPSKVLPMEKVLQTHFETWDDEGDVLDELCKIFDVASFPQRGSLTEETGISACSICLSHRGTKDELPEAFCPNAPCDQSFHVDCLTKYLRLSVQEHYTKVVGKCPYCKQRIEVKKE